MRSALVLALGVLLIRAPTLSEPPWYSDDGFFAAVAWAMARGRPLYADVFDDSPPGIYWLFRGLLALGAGDHNWVIQLAAALAVASATLLTTLIVRSAAPGRPALLAGALTGILLSIPTLDGDLLNVELAALPFFLGALALAFRGGAWPAASGCLAAAAVAIRPSYALDSVALLVPLLATAGGARRLLLCMAGGAAALLAVVGAMAATGSLSAYLGLVMPAEHAYLVWANGGSLRPLGARLAVLGVAGAVAGGRARTAAGRLASIWLASALAGSTLTPREFPHYAHEAVPAIAFAAALAAARVRPPALSAALAAASAAAAVHLALVLPALQTGPTNAIWGWYPSIPYSRLPSYYANWVAYAAGGRSWSAYAAWFPDYAAEQAAAAEVRDRAPAGATAVVLGNRPWLFVHAGVLPDTRYLATNSAFWRVRSAKPEMARRLEMAEAPVVVFAPDGRAWERDLNPAAYSETGSEPWPVFVRTAEATAPTPAADR